MPRFAANLSMLFTEYDFLTRFEKASKAGFAGVECLSLFEFDQNVIADQLQSNDLKQVLFNLPFGDWRVGERGIACLPGRVGEFQDGVGLAIEYARALGCKQMNCLAGIRPPGIDDEVLTVTLMDNLKFAAMELGKAGIRLLFEPINRFDIPGFFVNSSNQGLEIISAVESDNVYLQYDIYHMQRTEGELAATLEANLAHIRHIQIADNPGRHEPGTGEINYDFLFSFIDRIGYDGWVGCEYVPARDTESGLDWLTPYLNHE
ncbi:MAG: hydroxypyruvate isomerase [Gammaproteobacteria bacterium]|nr:hydroxypyruvate isomerase [Gammaproteobacteria bacterium]